MSSIRKLPMLGDGRTSGSRVAQVLRAVRRHRRMRPADVALAMRMPLRSYEHFEAGRGRMNLDRLHDFAEATDADPLAILLAIAMDSVEFAVRCADNKLATILLMALQDFDLVAADDIGRLAPRALIGAFTAAFETLAAEARARDPLVDAWLGRALGPSGQERGSGGTT